MFIYKKKYLYLKLFFIQFLINILFYYFKSIQKINYNYSFITSESKAENMDYDNNTFVIIKRIKCVNCGLFSNYIVFLGCINKYLNKGNIPIIDLKSYKNIFNGFNLNISNENPWEIFFNQPFGYSLNNVIIKGKRKKYEECRPITQPDSSIYFNKILMDFWHNLHRIYIPIKTKILLDSELIRNNLFKESKNVLGILMRGTDYIARKPRGHPIPPTTELIIKDIKEMNDKNKYNWYFLSTEDDLIRKKLIRQLGYKVKYYIYNKTINYNYKKKQFLSFNVNIKGNIQYMKVYLLNIIILSKCIDIISARTSGAIGAFLLNNGFRNNKIYNLGYY